MAERRVESVTLLFSDIEGSTRLVRALGEEAYWAVLRRHRGVLRRVIASHGGEEVECRADEVFAVFRGAGEAVAAAVAGQRALAAERWPPGVSVRVRMGLNAGSPVVVEGGYVGLDVNRAARICAAGHGGQVLCSQTVRDALAGEAEFRDLGAYVLAGLPQPERVFQLVVSGHEEFPPLRVAPTEDRGRRAPPRTRERGQASLEETAWQVRSALSGVPRHLRSAVGELGGALFTGQRAVERADHLLGRIDRRRLTKRHAQQREMAAFSDAAEREAASITVQIAAVEAVDRHRQALLDLTPEAITILHQPASAEHSQVEALRTRIAATIDALDDAVTKAAAVLDPLAFKLARTRSRGVYRSGDRYIVPYIDDLGADRVRAFATRAQARDFRNALRAQRRARTARRPAQGI